MPINDNKPTVFDAIITEITKNFSEVVDGIREDYNGPTEGFTEDAPEAPQDTEPVKEDYDIDESIVRLLEKAEKQADQGWAAGPHLDIVDRLLILRREV